MKHHFLTALTLAFALHAAEPADKPVTAPPDGRFQVSTPEIGDTHKQRLEIHSAEGKLLYSSPADLKGTSGLEVIKFHPGSLKWSADSKVVAIPAGSAHSFETFLFAWNGSGFDPIPMPALAADHDNPGIGPVLWSLDHRLALAISGPLAGKAKGYNYTGSAIVAVELAKKTARKVSENIEDHHDDEEEE